MYFRLAGHLGMTVAELLARISSREISEWLAYERIAGPIGPARADIQAAIIASNIVNVNRGKGKRPSTPKDFIPEWDRGAREQSPDEIFAAVSAFNRQVGGSVAE